MLLNPSSFISSLRNHSLRLLCERQKLHNPALFYLQIPGCSPVSTKVSCVFSSTVAIFSSTPLPWDALGRMWKSAVRE